MSSMQWDSLTVKAVRLDQPPPADPEGAAENGVVDGVAVLHAVELGRAAAMPAGRERDRFVGGRIAARRFAAELLGTDARNLVLHYACVNCGLSGAIDHGRPGYLSPDGGRDVRLSLSRTGPWCLLAGSVDPAVGTVGVDVEDSGRAGFAGFDDVLLAPAERTLMSGVGGAGAALRMRARLWARKEAFLKATGAGLFREPSDIDASADSFEGVDLADVDVRPLGLPAELVAALAIRRVR